MRKLYLLVILLFIGCSVQTGTISLSFSDEPAKKSPEAQPKLNRIIAIDIFKYGEQMASATAYSSMTEAAILYSHREFNYEDHEAVITIEIGKYVMSAVMIDKDFHNVKTYYMSDVFEVSGEYNTEVFLKRMVPNY